MKCRRSALPAVMLSSLGIALAFVLSAPASQAMPITFVANLVGSLEVPPTGSPATGHATVIIDPAANTMQVDVSFSGLEAPTTASHIHCCLLSPFETGVSVGVATTVPFFPGFPIGVTSGTYSHDFDLLDAASYNPAFVTLEGGTVAQAEAALIAGIEAGKSYLNIHTQEFPTGEIRGFLVAAPEPAGLVVLASAFIGFGLARRRRS